MGRAKMGEPKRAARQLGVTSTALRRQGWTAASPARVKAVGDSPPDWLLAARERCQENRARQRERRGRKNTAARLGVRVRVVRDRGITPGEVGGLLAARPDWLIAERERRQAQIRREAKDRLRRDLADALVSSVREAWFQELKHAASDADADAIGTRGPAEAGRARQEARQMAGELAAGQVRARTGRERGASREAGRYRAAQLARRASGGAGG